MPNVPAPESIGRAQLAEIGPRALAAALQR
jgi:hypothetical protein